MKKIKVLLLLVTMSAAIFYSCTDNNPVENEVATQKSVALRTVLNAFKKANNITGKGTSVSGKDATNDFCFEFVYPLNLSYNNGTVVSVASFEGLIDILSTETEDLYIDGIAFPFQVTLAADSSTVTINNEDDFMNLVASCDFETYDDIVTDLTCYQFVFPFSVVNPDGQTVEINSEAELFDLIVNSNENEYIYDFVYPFSVISNGETVVINSAYEFFELDNSCNTVVCDCAEIYDPVCVQEAPGSIIEFPNACLAQCAGYTSADFVACDGGSTAVEVLGTCFNFVYPVQIQGQGAVISVNSDNEVFQYFDPATGNLNLVYPLQMHFISSNVTVTVGSQDELLQQITQNCN